MKIGFKTRPVLLIAIVIMIGSCKKDKNSVSVPTLTTNSVTNLSYNTATSGGTITSNGGGTITASGICWSNSNATPAITTDSIVAGTTATGSFTSTINNLKQNTTYYIRAYATNTAGTGYGNVISFTTTVDTTHVTFTYMGQTVTYGVIVSPTTGRKWLDRNLGASRAATDINDSLAFGDYFQWGRLDDGHQKKTSDTTRVLSTTDVPGHNKFIMALVSPNDWRNPPNINLWQGTSGNNIPCPTGWHVPTNAEWVAETGITSDATAYSQLKLTHSDVRNIDGSIRIYGDNGAWWSSTSETSVTSDKAYYFSVFGTRTGGNKLFQKSVGLSVRCIKN